MKLHIISQKKKKNKQKPMFFLRLSFYYFFLLIWSDKIFLFLLKKISFTFFFIATNIFIYLSDFPVFILLLLSFRIFTFFWSLFNKFILENNRNSNHSNQKKKKRKKCRKWTWKKTFFCLKLSNTERGGRNNILQF